MCDTEKTETLDKKIQESFLARREVFLWTAVDDKLAKEIVQQLFYLDSLSNDPITLYINSPGGSVIAGCAILDAMDAVVSPIKTVVTGFAASMGAIIQSNGTPGMRYAWPRAKIMIHQPLINGHIQGVTSDISIRADQIEKTRLNLNQHLAKVTGQTLEKVIKDTDRDYWMTSEESLAYGMIDHIGATR